MQDIVLNELDYGLHQSLIWLWHSRVVDLSVENRPVQQTNAAQIQFSHVEHICALQCNHVFTTRILHLGQIGSCAQYC